MSQPAVFYRWLDLALTWLQVELLAVSKAMSGGRHLPDENDSGGDGGFLKDRTYSPRYTGLEEAIGFLTPLSSLAFNAPA